jgi:hypothetical protein
LNQTVQLHSLKQAEMNGCTGVICCVDDEIVRKGRVTVLLATGKEVAIKVGNLRAMSAQDHWTASDPSESFKPADRKAHREKAGVAAPAAVPSAPPAEPLSRSSSLASAVSTKASDARATGEGEGIVSSNVYETWPKGFFFVRDVHDGREIFVRRSDMIVKDAVLCPGQKVSWKSLHATLPGKSPRAKDVVVHEMKEVASAGYAEPVPAVGKSGGSPIGGTQPRPGPAARHEPSEVIEPTAQPFGAKPKPVAKLHSPLGVPLRPEEESTESSYGTASSMDLYGSSQYSEFPLWGKENSQPHAQRLVSEPAQDASRPAHVLGVLAKMEAQLEEMARLKAEAVSRENYRLVRAPARAQPGVWLSGGATMLWVASRAPPRCTQRISACRPPR